LKWIEDDNKEEYKKYYNMYKPIIQIILGNEEFEEIMELEKLYEKNSTGLLDMYYNKFKDDIVCVCLEKQTYYMFNSKNGLWEIKTVKQIQLHYMKQILIIIKPLVRYYIDNGNILKEKGNNDAGKLLLSKAKEIKRNPFIFNPSGAKGMMNIITPTFYKDNFLNKLDNDVNYLPVRQGLVDLQTGEFRKRCRSDYFSFELDVEWKGLEYETVSIDNFMNDIMLNNTAMVEYLQKLLGYSVTGLVREQKFIIWTGVGSNGKSVLMDLLKELLGPYYRQCSSDIVIAGKKNTVGSASPHIMQLLGARLAFVDESEMGSKLNESTVKSVTGGGAITCRPLFGQMVTFEPTFQLFLLTNHKPDINVNPSIERRLVLIPFLAEFKDKHNMDITNKKHKLKNNKIEKELKEKLDELLVWLVKGSVEYFNNGLGQVPDTAKKAMDMYLDDNDDIKSLINDNCVKDVNGFVYHKDLYQEYISTYGNISQRMFTGLMLEKGYQLKRKMNGRGFIGLRLLDDNDNDTSDSE
jgi:putative DNA primase/helicase